MHIQCPRATWRRSRATERHGKDIAVNSDEERALAVTDTEFAIAVVKQAAARAEERVSEVLERIQADLIFPLAQRVESLEQQVAERKATVAALRNAQSDFDRKDNVVSKTPAGDARSAGEAWPDFCRVCKGDALFRVAPNGQWVCTRCATHYHPDTWAIPVRRLRWPRLFRRPAVVTHRPLPDDDVAPA